MLARPPGWDALECPWLRGSGDDVPDGLALFAGYVEGYDVATGDSAAGDGPGDGAAGDVATGDGAAGDGPGDGAAADVGPATLRPPMSAAPSMNASPPRASTGDVTERELGPIRESEDV